MLTIFLNNGRSLRWSETKLADKSGPWNVVKARCSATSSPELGLNSIWMLFEALLELRLAYGWFRMAIEAVVAV